LLSGLVGDYAAGEFEGNAGNRAAVASVSGPVGINISEQRCRGKHANIMDEEIIGLTEEGRRRFRWKLDKMFDPPVVKAVVVDCCTEVSENVFDRNVVEFGWVD
jgi:hypothetical protein